MSEKSYPFDSEYLHKKMDKTFWTYGSIVLPDLLDSSADDAPAVSLEGVLRLFSPLEGVLRLFSPLEGVLRLLSPLESVLRLFSPLEGVLSLLAPPLVKLSDSAVP